jgi:predicted dithiol-disulfide oxidoreductase (DUF899 family)
MRSGTSAGLYVEAYDNTGGEAMPQHNVGTHEEWLAARLKLLEREKELTRRSDELARQRRELPWVAVEKDYSFETDEGTRTLAELFEGRSQLLVYHFMFGPVYTAGCPGCSFQADHFDGVVPHLKARDVALLCASRAPLEKLQAYKRRMGWKFPWVSSLDSEFNFDYGVSFREEQQRSGAEYNFGTVDFAAPLRVAEPGDSAGGTTLSRLAESAGGDFLAGIAASCGTDAAGYLAEAPGMSAFALSDGVVYHTYSTYARGLDVLLGSYQLLDRAPKGRDEGEGPDWVRRHDEYEDVGRDADRGRTGERDRPVG